MQIFREELVRRYDQAFQRTPYGDIMLCTKELNRAIYKIQVVVYEYFLDPDLTQEMPLDYEFRISLEAENIFYLVVSIAYILEANAELLLTCVSTKHYKISKKWYPREKDKWVDATLGLSIAIGTFINLQQLEEPWDNSNAKSEIFNALIDIIRAWLIIISSIKLHESDLDEFLIRALSRLERG